MVDYTHFKHHQTYRINVIRKDGSKVGALEVNENRDVLLPITRWVDGTVSIDTLAMLGLKFETTKDELIKDKLNK